MWSCSVQRPGDVQFLEMGVEQHYQFAKDAKAIRAPVVAPVVSQKPLDAVDATCLLYTSPSPRD